MIEIAGLLTVMSTTPSVRLPVRSRRWPVLLPAAVIVEIDCTFRECTYLFDYNSLRLYV